MVVASLLAIAKVVLEPPAKTVALTPSVVSFLVTEVVDGPDVIGVVVPEVVE